MLKKYMKCIIPFLIVPFIFLILLTSQSIFDDHKYIYLKYAIFALAGVFSILLIAKNIKLFEKNKVRLIYMFSGIAFVFTASNFGILLL